MQLLFNFYAIQYLFHALATSNIDKFEIALEATKAIPPTAQWANFLRNHDEIDLCRLTNAERNAVHKRMGPGTTMQLYDRDIRRRLAPTLGDKRLVELAYSLLLALPGLPVIRYGAEIGMGDDLSLQKRLSVRTPMQWSSARNSGFSTAQQTVRPVISQGPYRYTRVNVAAQQADSSSFLNHITRFARLRRQCPEIGWGTWQILSTGSAHVPAIQYN